MDKAAREKTGKRERQEMRSGHEAGQIQICIPGNPKYILCVEW